MRVARIGAFLVALAVVLGACGRVPGSSTATQSPSPASTPSPVAATPALSITAPNFHAGEVALAYTPVTLQASGGNDPFLWRVSDGTLPQGLTMSLDGVVSGTPTQSSTSAFTVEVTDAAMTTANLGGSIRVVARLALYPTNPGYLFGENSAYVTPCLSTLIGDCPMTGDNRYAPFATLRGGEPPYSYSVDSQVPPWQWGGYVVGLPPGTSLNGLALTGHFQLLKGSQAVYRFRVRVADSLGATATITVVVNILWTRG